MPIYTIKQSNINTILPQLQVDDNVKAAIQNAVNAGKEVTVSKTNITLNGWTGCGYIITNPDTGAGAYMISGGLSGGLLLAVFGLALVAIGLFSASATFGQSLALILYGLLYIGIGLCLFEQNEESLKVSLFIINVILAELTAYILSLGSLIALGIDIQLEVITDIGTYDAKEYCEGK